MSTNIWRVDALESFLTNNFSYLLSVSLALEICENTFSWRIELHYPFLVSLDWVLVKPHLQDNQYQKIIHLISILSAFSLLWNSKSKHKWWPCISFSNRSKLDGLFGGTPSGDPMHPWPLAEPACSNCYWTELRSYQRKPNQHSPGQALSMQLESYSNRKLVKTRRIVLPQQQPWWDFFMAIIHLIHEDTEINFICRPENLTVAKNNSHHASVLMIPAWEHSLWNLHVWSFLPAISFIIGDNLTNDEGIGTFFFPRKQTLVSSRCYHKVSLFRNVVN